MWDILLRYFPALVSGAAVTLQLVTIVWIAGTLLGILLGVVRASGAPRMRTASDIVFLAIGSVPILVYLLWAHYPLQGSLGIVVDPFATAAVVLSLYSGVIISDIVRGGILNFPREYIEVGRVNGVSASDIRRHIVLPIVLRASLPAYVAAQVTALHMTLFASLISVDELFRQAQRINSIEYRAVEVFSLLALFYFVLSFPLLLLSKWLDARGFSKGG